MKTKNMSEHRLVLSGKLNKYQLELFKIFYEYHVPEVLTDTVFCNNVMCRNCKVASQCIELSEKYNKSSPRDIVLLDLFETKAIKQIYPEFAV